MEDKISGTDPFAIFDTRFLVRQIYFRSFLGLKGIFMNFSTKKEIIKWFIFPQEQELLS